MTQTSRPKYAPGYDLFKLIVAIILTIILFFLLLRNRQGGVAGAFSPTLPPSDTPSPTFTETTISTLTAAIIVTETRSPTSTPTLGPTFTSTPAPTFTQTLTPNPAVATPAANNCPAAISRIKLGDVVRVNHRLNLRLGPGLGWTIILTNNPNTKLEVIGGPVCTTVNLAAGDTKAHLWWLVRMQDGMIGWSAEGQLLATFYLLEPIH